MSQSVVITGGNGFVGRHLIKELTTLGVASTVWDTTIDGFPDGVQMDITKPDSYAASLEAVKPDWIVHLAAIASVPFAWEHPDVTRQVNLDGTRQLLECVKRLSPTTKVLVVSSADMYPTSPTPIPELSVSELKAHNPYAESKLAMEQMITDHYSDLCIRVRPFPHIGPGQKKGFVTADFASQIAAIEKGAQEPVIKVGNLEAQRDFTDVRDVVRAYVALMQQGVVGEVYNVASGTGVVIRDLLDKLLAHAKVPITVEQDPSRMRAVDNPVIIGDASKLKNLTDWQPTIPLEQTLTDILSYWRTL